MIDAIMGTLNKWKLNEAKKRVKYLNKYKLLWLEEPLPAERMHDYKILKNYPKILLQLENFSQIFMNLKMSLRMICVT